MSNVDKVTFRVALVMDVECSSEAEAHEIWKEWVKTNKPSIRDVSNLVCCRDAKSSNGWHHSSGCKNWVLCY